MHTAMMILFIEKTEIGALSQGESALMSGHNLLPNITNKTEEHFMGKRVNWVRRGCLRRQL